MATDKVTGMLLQNLDEKTNAENENTENDSQEICPELLKKHEKHSDLIYVIEIFMWNLKLFIQF